MARFLAEAADKAAGQTQTILQQLTTLMTCMMIEPYTSELQLAGHLTPSLEASLNMEVQIVLLQPVFISSESWHF